MLGCLEEWEAKTNEIANLAEQNGGQTEELRRMIMQMKQIIREKDALIERMRKEARNRE